MLIRLYCLHVIGTLTVQVAVDLHMTRKWLDSDIDTHGYSLFLDLIPVFQEFTVFAFLFPSIAASCLLPWVVSSLLDLNCYNFSSIHIDFLRIHMFHDLCVRGSGTCE